MASIHHTPQTLGPSPRLPMPPRRSNARRHLPAPLRFIHDHSVSSAMLLLFALSLLTESVTGYRAQLPGAHGALAQYWQYLSSNDFLETVAENWEGEFLPLTAYVFFTSLFFERGSKESRNPDKRGGEKSDKAPSPAEARRMGKPWPLQHSGLIRWLYLHSLLLAFLIIFLLAVALHALAGLGQYNAGLLAAHRHPVTILGYMASNTFWLQSTRNWEAGFFSTAMLAVFSIALRQKGSPVSKDADQSNADTADEGE